MKAYADIADLPEDDRITILGTMAEQGQIVGFFVDTEVMADRYLRKLTKRFRVELVDRSADVVKNTVFVKIRRKPDA